MIRRDGKRLLWLDLYTATQPIYPIGGDRFEHRELFGRPSQFVIGTNGVVTSLEGWSRLPEDAPISPVEYFLRGELQEGRSELRKDLSNDEGQLFDIGFNLLETHRMPKAAVAVFEIGVERFPGSFGAWDALGDALKRAGNRSGGEKAERRADMLRAFRDRLREAFEQKGVEGGSREYVKLRQEFGEIPLGDLLERLSRHFREADKSAEAEAIVSLSSPSKIPKSVP